MKWINALYIYLISDSFFKFHFESEMYNKSKMNSLGIFK